MGSPVSTVITNLYMKDFEEQALSFAPTAPKNSIPLCWRHFYHLKTKWCWKSSTAASQHSTTNHPFYNGDWEWQHNSLFWHIGHKRFRRTPRYKCLQKTYALISVPYGSVKRGVVKCLYDRSKNIITKQSVIPEEKRHLTSALVSNRYPYSFVTNMITKSKSRQASLI